MTFRVGMKVVCIRDFSAFESRWSVNIPLINRIYTIREFEDRGTSPALRLIEVMNGPKKHIQVVEPVEPAFAVDAFRPVVERKTDISLLTALLVPGAKIRETA